MDRRPVALPFGCRSVCWRRRGHSGGGPRWHGHPTRLLRARRLRHSTGTVRSRGLRHSARTAGARRHRHPPRVLRDPAASRRARRDRARPPLPADLVGGGGAPPSSFGGGIAPPSSFGGGIIPPSSFGGGIIPPSSFGGGIAVALTAAPPCRLTAGRPPSRRSSALSAGRRRHRLAGLTASTG